MRFRWEPPTARVSESVITSDRRIAEYSCADIADLLVRCKPAKPRPSHLWNIETGHDIRHDHLAGVFGHSRSDVRTSGLYGSSRFILATREATPPSAACSEQKSGVTQDLQKAG